MKLVRTATALDARAMVEIDSVRMQRRYARRPHARARAPRTSIRQPALVNCGARAHALVATLSIMIAAVIGA